MSVMNLIVTILSLACLVYCAGLLIFAMIKKIKYKRDQKREQEKIVDEVFEDKENENKDK